MGKINYILAEDPNYDVIKLQPIKPGDVYHISGTISGDFNIPGYAIEYIKTNDVNNLKRILDDIINKNLSMSVDDIVWTYMNSKMEFICNNIKDYYKALNYMGDYSSIDIPLTSNIGDIYKKDNSYFVFFTSGSCEQVMTSSNLSTMMSNYYTKEQVDSILTSYVSIDEYNAALEKINQLSSKLMIAESNIYELSGMMQ